MKANECPAHIEALLGALLSYIAVHGIIDGIYYTAEVIAALCGAAIGLHGVWRIWGHRIKKFLHLL